MAIAKEEFIDTCEWLSEQLAMEMGDPEAKIYVDKPGSRILYLVNPREIKFFPLSLQAAAGVFHAAGEDWTISSKVYDVTNYGYYAGDDPAAEELTRRLLKEAEKLGVEEVILSECGHGFWSFRWDGPAWLGQQYPFTVQSVLGLLKNFIEDGRIRVDKSKNREKVTLHDPCNLVRAGGVMEEQRWILKRVVEDFVEMTPNRNENFCCGGGGGMLGMSEFGERRVKSGGIKAEQIRDTGAKTVACPCHNCADQLIELSKVYKLGIEVMAVIELVYNALVLPEKKETAG
jgi:Fe-S oxidoreductase